MQTIKHYLLIIALFALIPSQAQESASLPTKWSLQQCIEYARENNLALKRQKLNVDYAYNQQEQKKLDLLPNLNANGSYRTQSGSVRDENTFRIIDVTTKDGNFGIS